MFGLAQLSYLLQRWDHELHTSDLEKSEMHRSFFIEGLGFRKVDDAIAEANQFS